MVSIWGLGNLKHLHIYLESNKHMKKITIEGIDYFETEILYKVGYIKKTLKIYTDEPVSVDNMINQLVEVQATRLAREKLKKIVSEKVHKLLDLID